jgi:hypothetical protein
MCDGRSSSLRGGRRRYWLNGRRLALRGALCTDEVFGTVEACLLRFPTVTTAVRVLGA